MTNPTERDEQLAREWFRTPGTESEKESEWVALVAPLIAQVRLEEAEWWHERKIHIFYQSCCTRLAALRRAAGDKA